VQVRAVLDAQDRREEEAGGGRIALSPIPPIPLVTQYVLWQMVQM
jgi:hypothetical protein